MSVRNYFRATSTGWPPPDVAVAEDLSPTAGSGGFELTMDTTAGGTEIPTKWGGQIYAHQTRRLAAPATMSADFSMRHYSYADAASNSTLRVKISKVTLGGSDVEALIAQADAPSLPTTSGTLQNLTIPIVTPVQLATDERLLVRIFAVPLPGQTMGVGQAVFRFEGAAGGVDDTSIELPDGLTFSENRFTTTLIMRRTAVNGIGNFFDMLETRGVSAYTTGVVNTASGGTNIQWTRTAGGTALEWISPRLRYGVSMVGVSPVFTVRYWPFESATQANCKGRLRMFRRRGAVETQCLLNTDPAATEFGTTAPAVPRLLSTVSGATWTLLDWQEDDRIVVRLYITNEGTMASGRTCTVNYDGPTVDAQGDTNLLIHLEVFFKAESDPARVIIPGSLASTGMGN